MGQGEEREMEREREMCEKLRKKWVKKVFIISGHVVLGASDRDREFQCNFRSWSEKIKKISALP